MLLWFKKIYRKFGLNSMSFFKIDKIAQENYINSLKIPTSAIEKSYNQYLCQKFLMNKLVTIIMNIYSFIMLPYYEIKLLRNETRYKNDIKKYDAVFITDGIGIDTLPNSLINKYKSIKKIKFGEKMLLTKEDLKYFKSIEYWKKYPPYFRLKILLKTSMYSSAIKFYNPNAFISYCESSFTSQIITAWLENRNIANINIMHGEKLYLISDSFASFTKFYVWDEHYKKLLTKLKADKDQFIIELPSKLDTRKEIQQISNESEMIYDITYYLSDETEKELCDIANALKAIKNFKIKIRMHPRGNNQKGVKKYFKEFYIEDPNVIPLTKSFETTKYICSLNSTVLFEGYINKKEIILDDVSNKNKFQIQKELEYIIFEKKYKLLSKIGVE